MIIKHFYPALCNKPEREGKKQLVCISTLQHYFPYSLRAVKSNIYPLVYTTVVCTECM